MNQLMESLETRRLMAIFNATEGPDAIEIFASGGNTHVRINGVDHSTVQSIITINALGGDDQILVTSTLVNTIIDVFGDGGNDLIINPNGDMDAAYRTVVRFDGGAGVDSVVANNINDSTTPTQIEISDTLIVKGTNAILLRYQAIESLLYSDSDGSNTIRFLNLQGPQSNVARATLLGNGGDDLFINASAQVGQGNWATSIGTDGMTISGGLGNDKLVVENSLANAATFTLGANTLDVDSAFSNAGLLTYGGLESLQIFGTPNGDDVKLLAKPASMALYIDTGNGDDDFYFEGGDIDDSGFDVAKTLLLAGAGNDSIEFDDRLDDDDASESNTYLFSDGSLAKATAGFVYTGFEHQTLRTADAASGPNAAGNTVNLFAANSIMASTTILGGAVRGSTVTVGNGNLGTIPGSVTVDVGTASSTITIDDRNATGDKTYVLHANQLQQPRPISFTGNIWHVKLLAGTGNDLLAIEEVPLTRATVVNAGAGNDTIAVGNGGFANIQSAVAVSGGTGTDNIRFVSLFEQQFYAAVLTNNALDITNGPTHLFDTIESILLVFNGGGMDLRVDSLSAATTIRGAAGDDTLTVGNGNLNAITAPITFEAGFGDDTLLLDDSAAAGNDGYAFNPGNVFAKGATQVTAVGVEHEILRATSGHNTIAVNSTTIPDLRIFAGEGNDSVTVNDALHPVTVNTGAEQASTTAPFGDSLTVNGNGGLPSDIPATVLIDQDDTVRMLQVVRGGTLRIADDAVLCKAFATGTTFLLQGVIDLAGGALLVRDDGVARPFHDWLASGRNGGAWDGTSLVGAINSSMAAGSTARDGVGFGRGADIRPASIGSFDIAPGDTLVRYTLEGDANLDGRINLADFNRLAANFGQSGRTWTHGDSNYDGLVNLQDFNRLAANFGLSAAPASAAGAGSSSRHAPDELLELV